MLAPRSCSSSSADRRRTSSCQRVPTRRSTASNESDGPIGNGHLSKPALAVVMYQGRSSSGALANRQPPPVPPRPHRRFASRGVELRYTFQSATAACSSPPAPSSCIKGVRVPVQWPIGDGHLFEPAHSMILWRVRVEVQLANRKWPLVQACPTHHLVAGLSCT